MAKTPAVTTQLKPATARIAELEKKLAEMTASKDRYYNERTQSEAELEQVHAILDAIPQAPARTFTPPDAYGSVQRKTLARLAAYFAVRTA